MQNLPENVTSLGDSKQNERMRSIFEQVENAMKDIHLNDGDFLYFSDEHYRLKISSYRLTMEMRFPDGIKQTGN